MTSGKAITEINLSPTPPFCAGSPNGIGNDTPKTVNILFHRNIIKDKGGTSMYIRTLSSEIAKYFKVNVFMYDDNLEFSVVQQNSVRLFSVPRPKIPFLTLLENSSQRKKFYDSLSALSPKLLIISEKIAPSDYVLCIDAYCAVLSGPIARILGKKFVLRSNDSILSMASQIFRSYSKMQGLVILLYAVVVESFLVHFSQLLSVPSRKTKQLFKKYYGADNKVFVSPPGSEGRSGNSNFSIRQMYHLTDTQPVILFIGTGNWPPNILAIKYILNRLAPFLVNEFPDCRIIIVGSKTEPFKTSVVTNNVIIAGQVDDLGPYLEGSDMAIAPITVIGGVSAKTIEYLCSGLPVVTTDAVAETLVRQSGIYTSKMDSFHLKVAEILRNPSLREMKMTIQQAALSNYSWEKLGLNFATQLNTLSCN
jgi:glycosyltransferase involved in cell wall biosynthesis